MGYYTSLEGALEITPRLTPEHLGEIDDFIGTSGGGGLFDSDCPWVTQVNEEQNGYELTDANFEKPYYYVEWLEHLAQHVFKPRGYKLNGEIHWTGSEPGDQGTIYVKDNTVEAVDDVITNPGPSWGI